MVFSAITFLFVFLPTVLILHYILPTPFQNTLILISGIIFYAWGEPIYVFIMLLSTIIDFAAGLIMWKFDHNPKIRKLALILSVVMNISLLGIFKYSGFIITEINNAFNTDFKNPNLPLPIGISFYTFQSMSYTIDLYMRNISVQKNPMAFAAYVTMFPQVVAGPIVRYEHVAKELKNRIQNLDMLYDGILRFIIGLGKKVLIANNIGSLWSEVKILEYSSISISTAWLGILAFTFQIYFDFSGYSDMAIGLGKILGFNFPENFKYPYMSKSISEFWRRWHITLGEWFKSYVYFPLGGSRKGLKKTVINLGIVWFLTGIWHGASWNFLVWGSLYGIVIIIEKLFLGKILNKIPQIFCHIYTMLLVILGWVLFDTANISDALQYAGTMFGGSGILFDNKTKLYCAEYGFIFILSIIGSTKIISYLSNKLKNTVPLITNYLSIPVHSGIFILSTAYLVDSTYNPFLYFNF